MKAYNDEWIYNRELVRQAERWHKRGLLTDAQIGTVQQNYPLGFRQTNGILEVGLFLFTTLAILGTFLLTTTLVSGLLDERTSFGTVSVVFSLGLGGLGQQLINRRLLYRNGVDNAVAVLTAGFLVLGLLMFLPENLRLSTYCLAALPILLLALWYYGDTILAFLSLATFYTFVFNGMLAFSWGNDALPFVMMAVSGGLYGLSRGRWLVGGRVGTLTKAQTYYADPINLMESLSLVVLIASGNYFVVRELNGLLLEPTPDRPRFAEAPEIGLPALFWLLTFLIPGACFGYGLRTRNRILLSMGVLGLVAAVATLHEYAAIVSLNTALTLGGLALIGIAVGCIRYLQGRPADQTRGRFSDTPDDDSPAGILGHADTIAAIQAATQAQPAQRESLRFGEGNFGGGGSEGRY